MVMQKLEFGWFIPTRGDTDDYGQPLKVAAGLEMFDRVSVAASGPVFEYMLVPVGHQCWDAWMTGAMMTRNTNKIRMLIAARPSYINPVLLAKMISTFDQLSQGRISIKLIAGQSETETLPKACAGAKEQRYEIMDEEVCVLKALWTQTQPTDWNGKYYTLKKAELVPKPFQQPYPRFYLGGGSGQAAELSARHADVHLFWVTRRNGSPPTLHRCVGSRQKTGVRTLWALACACRLSAGRTRRMLGRPRQHWCAT
jgi:alkanesulfonate monooxygenase